MITDDQVSPFQNPALSPTFPLLFLSSWNSVIPQEAYLPDPQSVWLVGNS